MKAAGRAIIRAPQGDDHTPGGFPFGRRGGTEALSGALVGRAKIANAAGFPAVRQIAETKMGRKVAERVAA